MNAGTSKMSRCIGFDQCWLSKSMQKMKRMVVNLGSWRGAGTASAVVHECPLLTAVLTAVMT